MCTHKACVCLQSIMDSAHYNVAYHDRAMTISVPAPAKKLFVWITVTLCPLDRSVTDSRCIVFSVPMRLRSCHGHGIQRRSRQSPLYITDDLFYSKHRLKYRHSFFSSIIYLKNVMIFWSTF